MNWSRLFSVLAVLIMAAILQLKFQSILGWSFEFVLAVVIAASFFLEFGEVLFLGAGAALVLNWQPGLSLEVLTLLVLPFAIFLFRRFFAWEAWILNLALIFITIPVFYLVLLLPKVWFLNLGFILKDILGSIILGGLTFAIFSYVYRPQVEYNAAQ